LPLRRAKEVKENLHTGGNEKKLEESKFNEVSRRGGGYKKRALHKWMSNEKSRSTGREINSTMHDD